MTLIVDYGPDTNAEVFETMEEIEEWLDDYITMHLQSHEDFETEKQKFIDNQISEEQSNIVTTKISIFTSDEDFPHQLYGNAIKDDPLEFDRFYIYPDGRIEFCERVEYPDEFSADETSVYETLHGELTRTSIENELRKFFGGDVIFDWDFESRNASLGVE